MKLNQSWDNQNTDELVTTLLNLKTRSEARSFLRDLLTENELLEFGNRWKAARMLHEKASYLEIQRETGLSSTTVARISRWLQHGAGGYKRQLQKVKKHK